VDPSPDWLLLAAAATQSPSSLSCPNATGPASIEGHGGRMVLEKVRRGLRELQSFLNAARRQQEPAGSTPLPRILCMVYTIASTWGRRVLGRLRRPGPRAGGGAPAPRRPRGLRQQVAEDPVHVGTRVRSLPGPIRLLPHLRRRHLRGDRESARVSGITAGAATGGRVRGYFCLPPPC
jgi:hypothetical protein